MIRPVPMPGPNLFAPRKIRVCTGIQKCIRCDKPIHDSIMQAGWGFQTCAKSEKEGGRFFRKCESEWWALALPPDSFAGYLAALLGEDAAKIVLAAAFPKSAPLESPELWGFMLNPGDEQAWVQVAVRPRERHLHRRSRILQLATALFL